MRGIELPGNAFSKSPAPSILHPENLFSHTQNAAFPATLQHPILYQFPWHLQCSFALDSPFLVDSNRIFYAPTLSSNHNIPTISHTAAHSACARGTLDQRQSSLEVSCMSDFGGYGLQKWLSPRLSPRRPASFEHSEVL